MKDLRQFLKGLDLDNEKVDTIMVEVGKHFTAVKEENETVKEENKGLKTKVDTYESEIKTLKDNSKENDGYKEKFEALDKKIKDQETEDQKRKEDEVITTNILNSFGDKKFASEYAKNGLIADIKSELVKPENKGKGITELMEMLTKDKDGIFENPNKPKDMPSMGSVTTEITKDAFDKMSYNERIKFKQENPEQFKEFNN